MEQGSPIVRSCNNINRKRKEKSSFVPAKYEHYQLENIDIHNPLKKIETLGGFSIYHHHHHHKNQKNNPTTTRVVSPTKNRIVGGDELLPVDCIYNILSRMPLKSLARFQCVSKVWCKYINDPYLEIMYNAKRGAMKDDPTVLFMFQLKKIAVHLRSKHASASLSMLSVTKEEEEESHEVVIREKNTAYMEFRSKDWGTRFGLVEIILGSCNGLIISSQENNNVDDDTIVLLVINPLKKQCYKLPPIKIWSYRPSLFYDREACGLGFDDSTNTYKMVCVVIRNQKSIRLYDDDDDDDDDDVVKEDLCTMVHVLGTDSSSWREIPTVPPYPISGEGVFANGRLHWLVSFLIKYWPNRVARKVIYFDVTKEEFGLIDPPNTLAVGSWRNMHLVDLDGQVGLVYQQIPPKSCCIHVWLLNHKTKCWGIHCRFDLKPPLDYYTFIKVIGYWNKDTGDLLITESHRKRFFIYRLKQGVLHEANFIYEDHVAAGRGRRDIRLYQPTFSSILRSIPFNQPN